MRFRRWFLLLLVFLLPAADESIAASARTGAFWVGSDGHGTVSLFWLPTGGRWPARGFRLERIARKKRVVLAEAIRPGEDAAAMGSLEAKDAEAIRHFADRVRVGTLTAEERLDSIAVMGRAAAANPVYGKALGVRFTDRDPKGQKRSYRLTALGSNGEEIEVMETESVDPARRSPEPRRPYNLRAEGGPESVSLYWADPPTREGIPVVAYRIDRMGPGGKTRLLTPSPLVLDRHLSRGKPDFVHAPAPREPAVYLVRSVDIFGRRSEPASVEVSLEDFSAAAGGGSVAAQVSDWLATQAVAEGAAGDSIREAEVRAAAAPKEKPQAAAASRPAGAAGGASGATTGKAQAAAVKTAAAKTSPAAASPGRSASSGRTPGAAASRTPVQSPPSRPAVPEPPKAFPGATEFRVVYTPSAALRDVPPPPAEPDVKRAVPAAPKTTPPPAPNTFPAGTEFRAKYEPSDAVLLSVEKPARVPAAAPAAPAPAAPAPAAVAPPRGKAVADAGLRPPSITEIASNNGKVTITFRPAPPEARTVAVQVLRSSSAGSFGVSIGRPVAADAGRWEDGTVEPEQSYWYRLVAVDRYGNRSAPTPARFVRVVQRPADVSRRETSTSGTVYDGP